MAAQDGIQVEVGSREALCERFAALFEAAARVSVAERGRFACAIPGGSVAWAFLPRLRGTLVDWSKLQVFFGDERAVPPEHPDSNLALARRLWLDHVPIDPAHVHALYAPGCAIEEARTEAERDLVAVLGDPPRLDLALLGMGPDAHVASLFPGHQALADPGWVVALRDAPKPPPERLSLGLATLAHAREIVVAAFGAEKAAAVRDALAAGSALPAALVLRSGPRARLLLDPASAQLAGR